MRVLIVNSLFPPVGHGGAERSVAELADGLARCGAAVAVVTLAPPGHFSSTDAPEVTAAGVRVHRWTPPGPWPFGARDALGAVRKFVWHLRECYRPSARAYVRAVLRDFVPDVVHTNNIAGFGVAILHDVARYPWVHTLRDYYLLCPRTTRFRRGTRCGRPCLGCRSFVSARRLPRRAPDEVVGVSHSVLRAHTSADIWSGAASSIVPNRPEIGFVPRRRVERIKTVGFIGRVDEAKGAIVLLQAFAYAGLEALDLVLAGAIDDAARGALSKWTGETRIRAKGVLVAEQFFAQVDLVVVPSQWEEPYGRVAAEAGAVGLPVLVSRRGGLPEAVAGVAMSTVVEEPHDPDAWASAIEDAVERWHSFDVGGEHETLRPTGHWTYFDVYDRALARAATTHRNGRSLEQPFGVAVGGAREVDLGPSLEGVRMIARPLQWARESGRRLIQIWGSKDD